MDQFTKQNIPIIREAINKALSEVATQFGLTSLKAGNASFRPGTLTFKLEARCGTGVDQGASIIMQSLGFKPSIMEADLPFKGKTYKVIEPRRSKILMSCSDGKEYTMGIDMLKLLAKDHLA